MQTFGAYIENQKKNSKAEILATSWQPVGNHCEIGNLLATSWQPLRNWQTVGKQFAISVGIAKFANHIHCAFANFASHIKLQKLSEISHCQIRKPLCQIRKPLCQIRKPPCQIRNHFANFANHIAKFAAHCQIRNPLRNSQRLRTHCEVFAKFSIFNHCFALRFCFAQNFFIRTPF